ncbi:MAG TPA: S9 family peptidase [Vicinamibacterales bacterium]|nr:S9 family peptidase [Vicinamibacterales bacterium]
MTRLVSAAVLISLGIPGVSLAQQKRGLTPDDVYNIKDVRDPQRSPDGKWVAYVVSRAVKDTDKNDSDVWMVSWDGTQNLQITSSPESESQPRWSPDNKYLSFVSSRQGAKHGQLWLMNRLGGEAIKVSDVKGGIDEYAWSPDSRKIVFVVTDPDPTDPQDDDKNADGDKDKKKTPPPIVINRYHFKEDVTGYLRGERSHLYLFDVAAKKAEILTPGKFNEESPAWSPDSTKIAFVSKRGSGDLDRTDNTDVYVIDARAGAQPTQVTTATTPDQGRLAWSPDGKWIAYQIGEEAKYSAYNQGKLAIVSAAGGQPTVLGASFDRPLRNAVWAPDSASLTALATDDRSRYPVRISIPSGKVERLLPGKLVVDSLSAGSDGDFAVLAATDTQPPEVSALERGQLRRLTHQNDDWLAQVQLGTTEEFTSTSKDGTEVHGLIVKPANFQASQKYPTVLRIHGGPNGQDDHAFSFERELFAANGYVVVAANYRGSNGRGEKYQKAIFADWGNKEVVDLLGAMDYVQQQPYVDASRLGIGGWSYGCILTDYTNATDPRFKAATCGAGSALQLAMYGVDEYITQYENEIGPPWKSQDLWIKISYPFFHADRIKTPTLFLGGDKDYNVPLVGGEQMYQALKSLGIDTELIIYPNQFHGITVPSYKVDRFKRYVAWYDKYLKGAARTTTAAR